MNGPQTVATFYNNPANYHNQNLSIQDAGQLVGRTDVLEAIKSAIADPEQNTFEVCAPGGVGKSMIAIELIDRMTKGRVRELGSPLPKIFVHSFYSQGTKEHNVNANEFITSALRFLGDETPTNGSLLARGERLVQRAKKERVIFVLDGCEPLQYGASSPQVGQVKDQALDHFIHELTRDPQSESFLLLTTRVRFTGLEQLGSTHHSRTDLGKLTAEEGKTILGQTFNVDCSASNANQIIDEEFEGHGLAIFLLGKLLSDKSITDRPQAPLEGDFDSSVPGYQAWRIMQHCEKEVFGPESAEVQLLNILGLFDRPVDFNLIQYIATSTRISGFNDQLPESADGNEWTKIFDSLRHHGFLAGHASPSGKTLVDAKHPLVREYFGQRLEQRNPTTWRAGHGLIFDYVREQSKDNLPEAFKPDEDIMTYYDATLDLYNGIRHGTLAGRYDDAFQVLRDVLWRPHDRSHFFYGPRLMGLAGPDLSAMSCFFEDDFKTPKAEVTPEHQLEILNEAGVRLRNVGRMEDSRNAFARVLDAYEDLSPSWLSESETLRKQVAYAHLCFCELVILKGDFELALKHAKKAIEMADQTNHTHFKIQARTCASEVAMYKGDWAAAERFMEAAQAIGTDPDKPLEEVHYSQSGARIGKLYAMRGRSVEILQRADAGNWGEIRPASASNLAKAIDYYAEGMAAARSALEAPGTYSIRADEAFAKSAQFCRLAGYTDYLARIYLERAKFRIEQGRFSEAALDLEEVRFVVQKGDMQMFLPELLHFGALVDDENGLRSEAQAKRVRLEALEANGHKILAH